MAVYLITYDLKEHANSDEYVKLHEVIKSFGAWLHFLESTWLVDTNYNADTMSARIHEVYQPEYHLVYKLTPADRQGWLHQDAKNWITNRLG